LSLTGNNGLLAAAGANQPAYSIEQSVRLERATPSYLVKDFASNGNKKTWTFSTWAKRADISTGFQQGIFSSDTPASPGDISVLDWWDGGQLSWRDWRSGSTNNQLITSALYKDPAQWYHIVVRYDTTDSTAGDRVKLYVNGERVTNFSTANYPSLNYEGGINFGGVAGRYHGVGRSTGFGDNSSQYLAETHFIDGYALDASSFGETNSDTNQWQAIEYDGSYGTNGFYLKFQNSSALGDDSSGNTNDFTVTNLAATDQVKDSPSNNFCTLNPLDKDTFSGYSLTEGNLEMKGSATSDTGRVRSTFNIDSGKWYWEVHLKDISSSALNVNTEVQDISYAVTRNAGDTGGYNRNWATTTPDNSVIMVAFNADIGALWYGLNGTWDGSATSSEIAAGTTTNANFSSMPTTSTYAYRYVDQASSSGAERATHNFGQDGSFAGQKTAQGNTDGNGIGDFYYTPPTGYLALCSDNLPDPAIALPTAYFNTVLYTGTGSGQSISGVGFQPNFTWIKNRDTAVGHALFDSIRGATKYLTSSATVAESTESDMLTAFNSDGFSGGGSNQINIASDNYASWNWKGSDTPTKTFAVTVTNPGSGNRYTLDGKVSGTNAMPITIEEGGTYTFDQSDNTNSGHPLRFSTTSNGTWGGGSEYTTGVTTNGTPGSAGAYTRITVAASAPTLYYYCTNHSGMGAAITTPGSGGGVSHLDGTIASVVNANATAGFSIVSFDGNGTSGATVGHGLSQAPELIIVKGRNLSGSSASAGWVVYSKPVGNTKYLYLNETDAEATDSGRWNDTTPTASVFSLGDDGVVNTSSSPYIAYCFHGIDGYSKVGSYTGNGSTDGVFVHTGSIQPIFVMLKDTSAAEDWVIHDTTRAPYNQSQKVLYPNTSGVEEDSSNRAIDIVSNGFKARNNGGRTNRNGDTYIYYAVGYPFKTANAR
jgi:hypothetical protein